jgi:iron complex transport system ATP-binding protein
MDLVEPIFELIEATLVKDDRRVLDRLSLTIRAGEHTAILGPNGAGKSQLMRLLMHHERPLAPADAPASVRVLGNDNWNVFDLWTQVGFVSSDLHHQFVNGNSEGQITAEAAVVSAFLASQGILRYGDVTEEMRAAAARALAVAGASHLARRRLNQMSSGEARRVLLARVLATSPKVLVLDEPTTGLDLVARHDFMERVRGVARAGTTLLLITHHVEEIVPEIGRVLLLRDGRIVCDGPTRSVLTPERLSEAFGHPLAIDLVDGYYHARTVPAQPAVGVTR